ncbi:DUF1353 domain-containing protein [Leptospira wolffii]|uniref:Uncharacterized protein n=2 Tax=Leptospira wolffii TaxID=409998 RepID=A0A2M9ZB71_9LEPT|nr:DUF1353 domain-containing protein [Leptospira wolffii]PJZ65675.1 hypothetical protein CH371_12155 [Leptospira wolffii]TGK56112.1 DUF1353 domain-containing protein [Leptospira wolffii]TGK72158.1 DUF1353 domain-containing protein [Leptospira wolffii]TGK77462.1 DUF1353 domain-containing protein [Leptospira wolffii]TGL27735.1 DUF1353 domain-containing protein [Leptospira wolffii]
MSKGFSGDPITKWTGERLMYLEEDFYYIDSNEKKWLAPKGSCINGATIPQELWSTIGSPYTGKYRRASIVHDVAVGENGNPSVTKEQRREADRMFHEACLTDGCSIRLANLLYIGVSIGTFLSKSKNAKRDSFARLEEEELKRDPKIKEIENLFWQVVKKSAKFIDGSDLDSIDSIIRKEV